MLALVASSFPTSAQGWLDLLVVVSLKATVLLALAAALTIVLGRASAAARHLTWSVALVGLLILPLTVWTPGFRVRGLDLAQPEAPLALQRIQLSSAAAEDKASTSNTISKLMGEPIVGEQGGPAASASSIGPRAAASPRRANPIRVDWPAWILGVWLAGVAAMSVWLLVGLGVLARLSRVATPVTDPRAIAVLEGCAQALGLRRPVELWSSERTPVPCTWGIARPRVLIPGPAIGWPDERLRVVLLHELAHGARRDCMMQVLAQVACAIFWFHPLAGYAARRLRIERERACDDRVLDCDTEASDYADHLLAVVRAMRGHRLGATGVVAFARPSQLEGRLLALLDARQSRGALTASTARRAAAIAAIVVLPLALLRLGATPADASLTLTNATHPQPENGAASEVVQAPASEQGLVRRVSWAMGEADKRGTRGFWIAYAIRNVENHDGHLSDSGPIDLKTLDERWPGPRMADVLAGRRMKDKDVVPDPDVLVLAYHFTARGSRPEDVDRIRVQSPRLAADFGRQPLFWLGKVEDRESFDWARRVENGARNVPLRATALEAVAVHADEAAVRGHLRQVLQSQGPTEVRASAAEQLSRFHDEETLALLQATVRHDESEEVRQSAIEGLSQMHSPESVRLLSRLARDSGEPESTRQSAVEALGENASQDAQQSLQDMVDESSEDAKDAKDAKDAVKDLDLNDLKDMKDLEDKKNGKHLTTTIIPKPYGQDITVLDDRGRPEVTIQQRRKGQQIVTRQNMVQVQKERMVRDEQKQELQSAAVEALGKSETSLPRLVKIAKTHEASSVRRRAIEAMGEIGNDQALEAVLQFAWDDHPENSELAQQAVETLEQFDQGPAKLCDIAKKHKLADVRRRAAESLGNLDPKDRVVETLDDLVANDPDEDVQRQAVESIGQLPEKLSLPRLEKIARSHPSVAVRRQAIESLGDVDPAKAAPILESLIKDKKDKP